MAQTKTQLYKEDVLRLFYRTQLREGEEIINNQDGSIAKELGIMQHIVYQILAEEMISKIKMAGQDKPEEKYYTFLEMEELEVDYEEVKKPAIQYPISPKTKNRKGQFSKEPIYFNP